MFQSDDPTHESLMDIPEYITSVALRFPESLFWHTWEIIIVSYFILSLLSLHPFQSTKEKSNLTIESTNKMNAAPNVDISASPSTSFQTAPSSSHGASALTARTIIPLANAKHLKPFATEDIKVLLLENVNQTGRDILTQQGYQVEALKSSLPEDQLIEKIR